MSHGGGGRPEGGRPHPEGEKQRPSYRSHGNGRPAHPMHVALPAAPRGGWRGNPYVYGGFTYHVWGWGPWCPFYAWPYYHGWRLGVYYYVPEGLKCFVDNSEVSGVWSGKTAYYSSEDAINSALGYCENDPKVMDAQAQSSCKIRNCIEW